MNCANGHANPLGNRFCFECGIALAPSTKESSSVVIVKPEVGMWASLGAGCVIVVALAAGFGLFLLYRVGAFS